MSKEFHLGDVLTITTGRLLSPSHMDGVYSILNYMTRDDLYTHQCPRAAEECRPHLLSQYPQLSKEQMQPHLDALLLSLKGCPGKDGKMRLIREWLSVLVSQHGFPEFLSVERIPGDDHIIRDPVVEAMQMAGEDRVIVLGDTEASAP